MKVIGKIEGVLQEKNLLRKIEGQGKFSAIQITTAAAFAQS
ncbi:MAG: hypothetical protein CM15mP12_4940 [Gammaproteobacteria bacterium]|nr:MAG: hypothetical protein CM15mP12_4940 [Gammaproteobacteria bacterium]